MGMVSNIKVVDPVLRQLRYETGALISFVKPYMERYTGILEGLMENPPEETPGWHASELETSQDMAWDEDMVRMERAETYQSPHPLTFYRGLSPRKTGCQMWNLRAITTSTSRWIIMSLLRVV